MIGLAIPAACGSPPPPTIGPPPRVTPGPGEVPSANPSRGPSPPPGSITAEGAVAAAVKSTPGAGRSTTALWATIGPNPFASAPASQSQGPPELVWWVRLVGLDAPTCPGADAQVPPNVPVGTAAAPCLDTGGGLDALIDPATGALLGWGY